MDQKKVPTIDELLRDGEKATDLKGSSNVLVLVGKTGSGKSTLSKFMRKDASLTVIKNEQRLLMFGDGDVTIGSTDCLESKTFFPNVVKDEESGFLFVDCAGFEDTRSCEYDLTAAYMNKNLLDSADKMKVVLVENYSNLIEGNDRTAFINNLKHASTLIKDNIDSFEHSICLIATKSRPDHDDEQAAETISQFLRKTEKHLQKQKDNAQDNEKDELNRQIKIIEYMYDENHFSWFGEPKELMSPWEQQGLKTNYEHIRKLVFKKLKCSTKFESKFQIALAEETVNFVITTVLPNAMQDLKLIIKQIEEVGIKCFELKLETEGNLKAKSAFVNGYCEEVKMHMDKISRFEDFEILVNFFQLDKNVWDELQFQMKKLRFLHSVAKIDLAKFEKDAAVLFGWKDSLLAHFDNTLRFHKFLTLLLEDDQTCCVKMWNSDGDKLSVATFNTFVAMLPERMFDEKTVSAAAGLIPTESLVADLNSVLQACTPKYPDVKKVGNTIIFSGETIVLGSIIAAIKKHNNIIHTIVIAAAKILYVDCDINLQNTHLFIAAPQVIVHKSQRTFQFTGENGAFHSQEQAEKNTKALNGNAGFSSGSFRMFADVVKNANLLRISSVGGDGSNGQNGCDGTDAKTSPAPNFPSQKQGKFEKIIQGMENSGYKVFIEDMGEIKKGGGIPNEALPALSIPVFGLFAVGIAAALNSPKVVELKEIKVVNDNSIAPTDGGCGGNAGAGATAGEIEFVIKQNEDIKGDSSHGKSGKNGSGGKGGATAAKFSYKMYLCKVVSEDAVCASTGDFESTEKFPEAKSGKNGALNADAVLNYKFKKLPNVFVSNELGIGKICNLVN